MFIPRPSNDAGPVLTTVEFKAELRDARLARVLLRLLGAAPVCTLDQTDTYFRVSTGRLIRRSVPDEPTRYLFYEREDAARPVVSRGRAHSEGGAMALLGAHELGAWTTVRKSREVMMLPGMRVHLDEVERVGSFVELVAPATPDTDVRCCARLIERARARLFPCLGEAVGAGYSELALDLDSEPLAR